MQPMVLSVHGETIHLLIQKYILKKQQAKDETISTPTLKNTLVIGNIRLRDLSAIKQTRFHFLRQQPLAGADQGMV